MNLEQRLSLSYYKTIESINESHHIFLVKHQETGILYVKKVLDIYSQEIYSYLKDHPIAGIPKIIEYAEDNNNLIVIEEYISGTTLLERINSRQLTKDQVIKYMVKLCNILEKLHSLKPQIIHRDIKPSNIIITNTDDVVLLDFNAAKFRSEDSTKSSDTVLLGTQGYAAPEQYGFLESSPQTDIYSAGILLKNMISAVSPSDKSFNQIISKCTYIDPDKRFSSATNLKIALLRKSLITTHFSKKDIQLFPFLPPGFRTMKLWKMLIALPVYAFFLSAFLTFDINNVHTHTKYIARILTSINFIGCVFILFNYMNILRFIPLCNSKKLIIRIIGRIILLFAFGYIMFLFTLFIMYLMETNM